MRSRTKKRTILSLCLTFFLTLGMLGVMLCAEIKSGVGRTRTLKQALVKSNYTAHVQKRVEKEISALLMEKKISGLDLSEAVNYDRMYLEIVNYIEKEADHQTAFIDPTEFKAKLTAALQAYMENHTVPMNSQVEQAMEEIVIASTSIYTTYVTPNFATPIFSHMKTLRSRSTALGLEGAGISIILFVMLCCMYRYKHHAIQYAVYAGTTAVLLNGVAAIAIAKSDFMNQLGIGPDYYVAFLEKYLQLAVQEAYIVTGAGVIVVLLMVLSGQMIKRRQ